MATLKQINQEVKEAESLQLITQAFSDIASLKLKKIRAAVEQNRKFFNEVARVYRMVQLVATQQHKFLKKNNKTILIMLTSNYHFYGNLNRDLINYFVNQTKVSNYDKIVVGKTGNDFLKGINYNKSYQSIIFKQDLPNDLELKDLVLRIKDYQRILVLYSQVKTLLSQIPSIQDITETPLPQNLPKEPLSFIFEPEIEKVLQFFDGQITSLILEQLFFESELSRIAARLISMSEAESNAEGILKSKKRLLSVAKKNLDNTRYQQNLKKNEELINLLN
ncbi:F0F1 ATP synthase subunit gamma [Candidatus Daviesbacteria bacterium]|nr:F0F1 ATP synthase subunit gamma [Candidatus Daviesbacteria bacterium]